MQDWLDTIKAAADNTHPGFAGFMMAVFVSVIRVLYDREETSLIRIMLESLICGSLSLAAGSAISAMGYGDGWYLFAGGMIGFMGSQSVRALAYKFVDRKSR